MVVRMDSMKANVMVVRKVCLMVVLLVDGRVVESERQKVGLMDMSVVSKAE